MKCPNCGKDINDGAKFCAGCGTSLVPDSQETTVQESSETPNMNQTAQEVKEKVSAKVEDAKKAVKKAADSDFMKVVLSSLMFLFNMLLKPIKTLKEKIEFYASPKNGFILAGVIALASMIVRVVVSLINALIKKQCTTSLFGEKNCLSVGDKLGNIDWMGITLKHLLTILILMFAVAGIYYVASLIVKKTTNFMRLLTIAAVSLVPMCIATYLLSPILGSISLHIGFITTVVGMVYSLVIFFTAMKDEITFGSADQAVYFNLVCVSVIIIVAYIIGYNILVNTMTSSIGGLGNLNF